MPACPECNTDFDDEEFCPKCGAKSPVETWPRPSDDTGTPNPDYGSFSMFCLHLTHICSILFILWSIGLFVWHLFQWENAVMFLASLISIPISIAIYTTLGIAIRYAQEKNGTR